MDDIEIENLLESKNKKIKSKPKGKRVELQLVKDLNKRFDSILRKNPKWGKFSRTVGSGNRWGQNVHLSKIAMDSFSGDIVCPPSFKFVIESKGGYNEIDLCSVFSKGNSEIESFLKQVSADSERTGRMPLLFWKKDRKPRLAFLKIKDIKEKSFEYYMKYKDWIIIEYDDLIAFKDEFFFEI